MWRNVQILRALRPQLAAWEPYLCCEKGVCRRGPKARPKTHTHDKISHDVVFAEPAKFGHFATSTLGGGEKHTLMCMGTHFDWLGPLRMRKKDGAQAGPKNVQKTTHEAQFDSPLVTQYTRACFFVVFQARRQ